MTLLIAPLPVPLRATEGGKLCVGDTRVSLDTLIDEYEAGADPDGIVNAFPALRLADVHAVIAYYLNNRDEVRAYLEQREAEAEEFRREIESRQSPTNSELRARLLARRERQEQDRATPRG